jgi:hypothetical protein
MTTSHFAIPLAILLAATPAWAQTGTSAKDTAHEGRSVATAPACCNPAASTRDVTRRPGFYVGMPLKPGDLGYNPNQPER